MDCLSTETEQMLPWLASRLIKSWYQHIIICRELYFRMEVHFKYCSVMCFIHRDLLILARFPEELKSGEKSKFSST